MAGLCLLPLLSGASLSAWELVRLAVVLAAVSCLGRREWHAGRLTKVQPLVYLFIVAQFCREAPTVVWWLTWVIVGGGLVAVVQHSCRNRSRARERRFFWVALWAAVAGLVALQGLQSAHLIVPWGEWTLSRDLLALPVAIGAYLLGRRGIRLAPVTYAIWGMRVCTVVFGVALLHGVWQFRVVHSLQAEAQERLRAGAYEAAVDKYREALSRNTSTVDLETFGLARTLVSVAASPTVGVAARAYVRARILEVNARSHEEWSQILGLYRKALGDAGSVPTAWRRNCRRGIGLALVYLDKWGDLARNGGESIREEPELLRGWVQKCVGLMKQGKYRDAQAPFNHVVEVLAARNGRPTDSSGAGEIWTMGELLRLLPESCLPFAEALSYGEVVGLLENTGLLVLYEDQRVGSTDVTVPVPLQVLSSGYAYLPAGRSIVKVNGAEVVLVNGAEIDRRHPEGRGYSLVAVDPEDGSVAGWSSFDTHLDARNTRRMLEWVEGVPDGHIIVGTVYDEATEQLGVNGIHALRLFGSSGGIRDRYRWAHAVVGVKGGARGSAAEVLDPKRARLSLIVGNMPDRVRGLRGRELLTGLHEISSSAGKRLVYISGVDRDDEVILVDGESPLPAMEH